MEGGRFVAVEMPVLFREPHTGIALLGGTHAAQQAATGRSSHVDVRLRPHDPFCHKARIQSSDQEGAELVLRVRKGTTRPEVLGVVERAYRRPLASDFQFLPSYREEWDISSRDVRNVIAGTVQHGRTVVPLAIARELQAAARSDPTSRPVVAKMLRDFVPREGVGLHLRRPLLPALLIPPSSFAQEQEPRPFDFAGLRTRHVTSEESRRESTAHSRAVFVPKPGVTVPSKPLAVPSMQRFPGKDRSELLRHLVRLFELRPVWNRRSIAALLRRTEGFDEWWKLLLPAVAYFVQQGPFRYSWIRLGYDTSGDPTSRVYQTLDARLTQQRLSAAGMRNAAARGSLRHSAAAAEATAEEGDQDEEDEQLDEDGEDSQQEGGRGGCQVSEEEAIQRQKEEAEETMQHWTMERKQELYRHHVGFRRYADKLGIDVGDNIKNECKGSREALKRKITQLREQAGRGKTRPHDDPRGPKSTHQEYANEDVRDLHRKDEL